MIRSRAPHRRCSKVVRSFHPCVQLPFDPAPLFVLASPLMKHPVRWLIALALCACALAWWGTRLPRESMCEGRPLSQWMREHWALGWGRFDTHAVRPIATAAVPWLAHLA